MVLMTLAWSSLKRHPYTRRIAKWVVLVLGFIALWYLLLLIYSHYENGVQTDGGKDPSYFINVLVPETKSYFQTQAASLGIPPASVQQGRYCYIDQDIGGVWAPPQPELQCQVMYTSEIQRLSLKDRLQTLDNLFQVAVAQGFETSSKTDRVASCEPPNYREEVNNELCLTVYKGPYGRGYQLPRQCIVDLSYDSAYNPPQNDPYDNPYLGYTYMKYSIHCYVRAAKVPPGFTFTSDSRYDPNYNL